MATQTAERLRDGSTHAAGRNRRADTLHEMKRNKWAYLFISPFFLLYAVFGIFPLFYGLWLSLFRWDAISPMRWMGFANYAKLLTDDIWWKAVYNTVWLFFGATIPQLTLALVLAFIINSSYIKGKDIFRAAYFMPIVASSVAVGLIFSSLFGEKYGMLNYFIGFIGLGPIDWLQSREWLKPAIALVTVWQWTGYSMIIFLAGLQSINPELYEAARVDGATTRHIFRYITVPLLRPVILFQVILSIIGAMQTFDIPVMLTNGGTQASTPGGTDRAGLVTMVLIYWTAFKYGQFGFAAAMAFVLFLLIVLFSFLYNRWQGGDPTS